MRSARGSRSPRPSSKAYVDLAPRSGRRSRASPRPRQGRCRARQPERSRAWRRRSRARPTRSRRRARPLLALEQQLETELRRRVGARAEGPAGVDDDRGGARRRRTGIPGRADPEASDANRAMEVAPALLPAVRDLLLDDVAERAQADGRAGRHVDRQLEPVGVLHLLPAAGRQIGQPGPACSARSGGTRTETRTSSAVSGTPPADGRRTRRRTRRSRRRPAARTHPAGDAPRRRACGARAR